MERESSLKYLIRNIYIDYINNENRYVFFFKNQNLKIYMLIVEVEENDNFFRLFRKVIFIVTC